MKTETGSTRGLLLLCAGYFVSYVFTGILVKYFTIVRTPHMSEMTFLFNNTLGSVAFCCGIVLILRWYKHLVATSNELVRWGPFTVPTELSYIIPSGVCTAIVIPATTLMYMLPVSVMIAMVIMRSIVIVISWLVDVVQIRQGILQKTIFREVKIAVVLSLLALAMNILLLPFLAFLEKLGYKTPDWMGVSTAAAQGAFKFLGNTMAMTIIISYTIAYAIRIYIMNYYKNTRPKGVELDNRGFFTAEQLSAAVTILVLGVLFALGPTLFGWKQQQIVEWGGAVHHRDWVAIIAGLPYAAVAFTSVFIFMYKGRTATFAGLANRLTSLLAGIVATTITFVAWGSLFKDKIKPTKGHEWLSLIFVLAAVYYMYRAEKKRAAQ